MKKVLFATTALIATAGMAAADVKISGYGRFGLDYNDANDRAVNGISKTTITSRLRLQFDMSTETDSGVAFGARFRAQAESRDNTPGGATFNGARFFVGYQGISVYVGNIIGAIENTPGMYLETRTAGTGIDGAGFVSLVSNVNGEYFNWDAYSSAGAGANGVEVLYSTGGFTGHISYSTDNGPTNVDRVAGMVSYKFGDWRVAVSAQSSDIAWEDKVVASVSGNIGNFGVRLAYADNDGIGKFGLYGNMDIGSASNILVWVTDEDAVSAADVANGRNDNRDGVAGSNNQEGTSYGIHYHYDLGGGASFETGYRKASNDNDTFQAGVYFSF
ncbi:porin [Jhaorihella thermophila]|uniref:Outer membrane protein OmpU n=2 Tax=Jhaorihella thermophila TaxID=488547 RepID=A0A1H5UYL1_9RHOB|nr:porin [Jhaorihella thermophila]SEF80064.1 outer membrane protein OmpU [Jhaorihella thermophila]